MRAPATRAAWSGPVVTSGTVTQTMAVLRTLAGVWDGEAVDELDHALQTAARARELRPDDDAFVVAGLLHDVGRSSLVAGGHRDRTAEPDHAAAARAWLTPRYGERVGWLAGAHVAAKRHLAHHEPAYAADLSSTSLRTLGRQGGAGPVDRSWTEHEWWPDALALRRCDDAAKVVGAPAPDVAALRPVLHRVAGSG